MRRAVLAFSFWCAAGGTVAAQTRELPPNTGVPPNHDYYTLDAGYTGEPVLGWADIVGDWREEIVTYADGELRVYTTTIPAADRRPTLTQDPIYRLDVAHEAMGYDMPPMTSFYLGTR